MLTKETNTPNLTTLLRKNNLSITLKINPGRINVKMVEIKAE
ncbi:hypothetical protein OCC_14120 [Thermococcus litoralis DSM 5473]|jgi:hypothetical protein|uniref:Uncharacterized protein n=1 Tax=Thermococcus litoralis (strain ATCC 51850 / DSM 5473 / JCM 8560 / NS-C) TaxID=523849 RepID=S5ZIG2_THELN|nr:hypothetical protein OCC_14120 [Thermococcus litoralis DSM 5473]MDK2782533.1 hypothetical protein [Thermococcaceae archaeon]